MSKFIYGWERMDECCFEIEKRVVDVPFECGDDGLVDLNIDGFWYSTFIGAKRAAIRYWLDRRRVANLAYKSIRSLRSI